MPDRRRSAEAPVLELTIERPAAGGRMIGRHDGQIVFVAGAIPGERVRARVERSARHALWARTIDVIDASQSRRPVAGDPACGGLDYAHVSPERQRALKSEIIVDAFRRIGKLSIDAPAVEPSPEHGYRLRARLHVQGRRVGFFRAGTHALCDARAAGQLLGETCTVLDDACHALGERLDACRELIVAENVRATERVLHLVPGTAASIDPAPIALPAGVSGVTTSGSAGMETLAGGGRVTDTAHDLFGGEAPLPVPGGTAWSRGAASFFQGNRYVTGALVRWVLEAAAGDRVVDLYAGVGLFAVALAARGASVTAVEGDPAAVEDLVENARAWPERLAAIGAPVESGWADRVAARPDAIVLDPPRTGLSPAALQGAIALGAPCVVYVSCDPATLARDAAAFSAAGYVIDAVRAFDLFPNTAHIETAVRFSRSAGAPRPPAP
jgi:23S rRNA (uracil1939-C5)-methyltransferase